MPLIVDLRLTAYKSDNWTEINFKCLSAANDPAHFYLIRKFFSENSISILRVATLVGRRLVPSALFVGPLHFLGARNWTHSVSRIGWNLDQDNRRVAALVKKKLLRNKRKEALSTGGRGGRPLPWLEEEEMFLIEGSRSVYLILSHERVPPPPHHR